MRKIKRGIKLSDYLKKMEVAEILKVSCLEYSINNVRVTATKLKNKGYIFSVVEDKGQSIVTRIK